MKKYAFMVDLRRCVGCTACQVSCKMENGAPIGTFRTRVQFIDGGEFPNATRRFLPLFCNHCDDAPCIPPCPVPGATFKRDDGAVVVDRDLCIGCGKCVESCPYGARYLHPYLPIKNNPRPYYRAVPGLAKKPVNELRVADKCDWCSHRLAEGLDPACARNCFGKAIVFGDLNDPDSRISKLLASTSPEQYHPDYGTKPRVFYVPVDKQALKDTFATVNPV